MGYYHTLLVLLFTTIVPSFHHHLTGRDKPAQPTHFDQQPVSSTATQPDFAAVTRDARHLREVLGTVNEILFRGTGLPRIQGSTADGRSIEGFEADSVIQIAKEGKERVNKDLEKKEFAGVVAYVNKFYEIPTYESLERVGRTRDGRTLITPDSKNSVFERLVRVIKNVLNIANETRLAINLRVNSQPEEEATFEIWPASGPTRSTVTNNTLDSVYRGYYTYQVTKKGYKTIKYDLNLVEGDGRTLDCTMNKNKDSKGPIPCKHH